MEYLYILIAVLGISGVFLLKKVYQKKYTEGLNSLLLFSFWFAFGQGLFSFCINKFQIHYATITLICSLIVALTTGFNNIAGVAVMKYCKISLQTMFIMTGGMIIPSLFGVFFLHETLSVWRVIGMILLVAALIVPVFEKKELKTSKKGIIICLLMCIFNGINNIATKYHQLDLQALNTQDFLIWKNLWLILITLLLLMGYWIKNSSKKRESISYERSAEKTDIVRKTVLLAIVLILITGLISGVGEYFNVLAAKTADATLLYPLTTGGCMVLSAVFGRLFFAEKITKYNAVSLVIAVIGTTLFVL